MRTRTVSVVLASLLAITAACGGSDGDDAAPSDDGGGSSSGGDVVIVTGNEPTTLDPQLSEDYAARVINLGNIYETLLERTPEGELVPLLATDLPTRVDDDTWQFKLRDDVTFHDGSPFNADAVAYSVNRIISDELESEQIAFFETIAGATAVDETTVDIDTNGPDPLLPTRMFWLTIVADGAGDDPDFAQNPNGTGPFKFVEWNVGQDVVLERNDDYWGEPATIDTVTVRSIPDPGAQVAALQTEEVDLLLQISPEQAKQVPSTKSIEGTESPIIRLDSREGILADVRVRQALNYAVDKQTLVDTLLDGFARPSDCQVMAPGVFGYNPDLKPYPYDPEKARQLLEEAGAVGAEFTFTGISGRFVRDRELAEAITQYFNEVGLKVTLEFPDIAIYLDHLFVKEQFPDLLYISSSNELFDGDKQMTYLESTGRGSGYVNEEVDALAASARVELDVDVREGMYQDLNKLACDDAANVFLVNTQDIYGMSEDLNWEPRRDGLILAKSMSITSHG